MTNQIKLTPAMQSHLQQAIRNGGTIRYGVRARVGGAIRRMCNKLSAAGLIEGPPWRITEAGRKAVDGAPAWCPFCKKRHVGGSTCMGHHP